MNDPATNQAIFPVIRYRDPNQALTWLGRAFGAKERVIYRDDAGGVKHAELELEGNLIMVGHADPTGWFGGIAPEPLASPASLYVVITDPDPHHARSAEAGAQIVRGLVDKSYGSREYSARDIEGNLWSFGTYDPARAPE